MLTASLMVMPRTVSTNTSRACGAAAWPPVVLSLSRSQLLRSALAGTASSRPRIIRIGRMPHHGMNRSTGKPGPAYNDVMPLTRQRASMLAVLQSVALLAALIVWVLPGLQRTPAPAVEFGLLDGSRASLAELRGRPVLLVFWATSCPPCVDEVPDLVKLHQ